MQRVDTWVAQRGNMNTQQLLTGLFRAALSLAGLFLAVFIRLTREALRVGIGMR